MAEAMAAAKATAETSGGGSPRVTAGRGLRSGSSRVPRRRVRAAPRASPARGRSATPGTPRVFPAAQPLFNPRRPPGGHQCTNSAVEISTRRRSRILAPHKMKTAVLLFSVVLLVATTLARPAEPEDTLVRERRAPEDEKRGTVTGGVHKQDGVGTVVQAQGQGNVWKSKDGNSRVDAQGEWSKVVDGPQRGKPNYNVGIKFSSSF